MSGPRHYILLCSDKRQQAYSEAISKAPHPIEVVSSPEQALQACIRNPPLAVIIDMMTSMRMGTTDTSLLALYSLELSWPVLQATAKKNEPVMLVSTSPKIRAPLSEGLAAIAANSPQWNRRKSNRRFIRQQVQCRTRIRPHNAADWLEGTIVEMSTGGCFVVTFSPLPAKTKVVVEILDLDHSPIVTNGSVVWIRDWADSVKLPGMGLQFEFQSVPPQLADALAKLIG